MTQELVTDLCQCGHICSRILSAPKEVYDQAHSEQDYMLLHPRCPFYGSQDTRRVINAGPTYILLGPSDEANYVRNKLYGSKLDFLRSAWLIILASLVYGGVIGMYASLTQATLMTMALTVLGGIVGRIVPARGIPIAGVNKMIAGFLSAYAGYILVLIVPLFI